MERDYKTTPPTPPKNNKSANIVGAAIVFLGLMLLLRNLDLGFYFPRWIFGWEMILIIIGVVIGINSKFEKRSSVILIVIGGLFLLKKMLSLSFGGVIIPLGVIILGIFLIMKNRKEQIPPTHTPFTPTPQDKDEFDWDKRIEVKEEEQQQGFTAHQHTDGQQSQTTGNYTFEGENYIKVDTIFGDSKKKIFSKNFLGGTMTNLFGSSEINLIQADIQQPVALDVFQLFGSTKIIVPPHWMIATTVSSILSENDDRRVILTYAQDENKYLYITGTSIFGSITIKNS